MFLFRIVLMVGILQSAIASADCVVVDGDKKSPFDGSSLSGLAVEKKSVGTLSQTFPALNVHAKVFSGDVKTCVDCAGTKHVKCE